jgi:hypothetical protein
MVPKPKAMQRWSLAGEFMWELDSERTDDRFVRVC